MAPNVILDPIFNKKQEVDILWKKFQKDIPTKLRKITSIKK